jgi:acetyl esterase/lipase
MERVVETLSSGKRRGRTISESVVVFLLMLVADSAIAAEPTAVRLWKDGAPGTPATKPADEPVLLVYTPTTKKTGVPTGIIVLPGGGYGHLAMDHEGKQIAEWLNSLGITAFVLKYRMSSSGHRHPVPMLDAQRAIRTVRANAKEYKIDPARIGVLGFSAGGHLASTVGTHFDDGISKSEDPIERASSRPDFLILCYPVISLKESFSHRGSRTKLLGDSPDPALVESLSNETQVTAKTPPAFIFQTTEDKSVPAENAVAFYQALRKASVPAEMHIFQAGRHGLGLAKDVPGTSKWPELCELWMKNRGLLEPSN